MPRRSSVLLINEPPLQALPSLACLVGINGAIILQQIHYWIQVSEHRIEGYTWIYNSYNAWAKQFKWLKPHAIQWHIRVLEKSGYLISRQFKYKARNNTKWYRIDYEKLDAAHRGQIDYQKTDSDGEETDSEGQETDSEGQETDSHSAKNGQSLRLDLEQTTQKTIQKTTQKTTTEEEVEEETHLSSQASGDHSSGGHSGETPSPSATTLQIYNKMVEAYLKGWGMKLTGKTTAQIRDYATEFSAAGCPESWVLEAFKEAAKANIHKLSYVRAMLLDWLGVPREHVE